MISFQRNSLSQNLTSYDLLKYIAVIFMIIDHIGAFFIPDELWLRVFGRLGFPAFFFLAGYTADKKIKPEIIVGAIILLLGSIIFGDYIFPLNALVTYLLIKIFIKISAQKSFSGWEPLLYMFAALIFLAWPTNQMFEYGSYAFLLGMMGFWVRNNDAITISRWIKIVFFVGSMLAISIGQTIHFRFNEIMGGTCVLLFLMMGFVLYHFKPTEFPDLTKSMSRPVSMLIQFCGRHTLAIYVIHLLAIKTYLAYAGISHFEWFNPLLSPR